MSSGPGCAGVGVANPRQHLTKYSFTGKDWDVRFPVILDSDIRHCSSNVSVIRLRSGPHQGRLWASWGQIGREHVMEVHAKFSDDDGVTWIPWGKGATLPGSKAAEWSDGTYGYPETSEITIHEYRSLAGFSVPTYSPENYIPLVWSDFDEGTVKLLKVPVPITIPEGIVSKVPLERQLLEKCPLCDMDKNGILTPSEIWYARSLAKGRKRAAIRKLADQLIKASYTPPAIDESKTHGPVPGKKTKLFILSGQSNMVGQGMSAELTEEQLAPNDRILMFEQGKWQPLRPLKHTFGTEISFARIMAKTWPDETIGIVKQSVGGTGILAWHPQWTEEKANLTSDAKKGNLWKALTNKIRAACNANDCEIARFIWRQGGKDMQSLLTGKMYLQNLKALVEGLRKETNTPNMPLVLGSYRREGIPDDLSDFDPAKFEVLGALADRMYSRHNLMPEKKSLAPKWFLCVVWNGIPKMCATILLVN